MFPHPLSLVILLICCLAITPADADEPPGPSEIAEWVVQLDDDRYATRKSAQQELERAGLPALEAVAKEARNGSLESSTRALNVMLEWTESADHDLQIAALEMLVTLPNRPIESGLAAELLADAREQAALAALTALGGRHKIDVQVRPVLFPTRLQNIQVIIDSHWKGEPDGLKHLAAVRRATTISFHSAPLGDGVLEYLIDLPNVQRIEFYGTPVSKETVEELEKHVPKVEVRSGALLGISGDGHRQGPVTIREVVPDSAAAKAELRRNDAITELDGEKIKDFNDLTSRIGKFQPGDSALLTIMRDGKVLKKEITFDRWGKKPLEMPTETRRNVRNVPARGVPAPRKITLDRR